MGPQKRIRQRRPGTEKKRRASQKLRAVFMWDLSGFNYPEPSVNASVQVRYARGDEIPIVALVWRHGIEKERGSPWTRFLRRWTVKVVERWFRHYTKRYTGHTLVAEKDGEIVGVSGPIFRTDAGIGRIFAGIVVAPEARRQGIGSLLLYRTLREIKSMGCHRAIIETLRGITASKYLYPKFGGVETTRR